MPQISVCRLFLLFLRLFAVCFALNTCSQLQAKPAAFAIDLLFAVAMVHVCKCTHPTSLRARLGLAWPAPVVSYITVLLFLAKW